MQGADPCEFHLCGVYGLSKGDSIWSPQHLWAVVNIIFVLTRKQTRPQRPHDQIKVTWLVTPGSVALDCSDSWTMPMFCWEFVYFCIYSLKTRAVVVLLLTFVGVFLVCFYLHGGFFWWFQGKSKYTKNVGEVKGGKVNRSQEVSLPATWACTGGLWPSSRPWLSFGCPVCGPGWYPEGHW